jgi:MoxR-like ATPase
LLDGRPYVSGTDLVRSAAPALRHRILLGYEAAADGIATDDVIDDVITTTSEPGQSRRGIA